MYTTRGRVVELAVHVEDVYKNVIDCHHGPILKAWEEMMKLCIILPARDQLDPFAMYMLRFPVKRLERNQCILVAVESYSKRPEPMKAY